jgi:hypothetical protein
MPNKAPVQYSTSRSTKKRRVSKEIADGDDDKRRDEVLKRLLSTPPKPRISPGSKRRTGKPGQ